MSASDGPTIVIVGGGSQHWTPRLVTDFLNTPSFAGARIVLHDVDTDRLAAMGALAEHLVAVSKVPMTIVAEADRARALRGAQFVVVAIAVGGLEAMRHDIEIPVRWGIRQPIGDSVGPAGICRALRSVPVMSDIAADVARCAPDAWLINVSNPLSALTHVAAHQTDLRVVGLCNEVIGTQFVVSLLTDVPMHELSISVGGVNHFPVVTSVVAPEGDGLAMLAALIDDGGGRGREPLWMDPPDSMHWTKSTPGPWTKGDVVANIPVKLSVFAEHGVLPAAHDSHIAEFMPGFLAGDGHEARWRIHHYEIDGHRAEAAADAAHAAALRAADRLPRFVSGELVAPLIDSLLTGARRVLPVNVVHRGEVAPLPPGAVVECMAVVDHAGIAPQGDVVLPGIVGEWARRAVVTQQMTVDAATHGSLRGVRDALRSDPLTAHLPPGDIDDLGAALVAATAAWLPRFA